MPAILPAGLSADLSGTGMARFDACYCLLLPAGLSAGLLGTGLASFDILGFDACLMGGVETLSVLAPLTQYFLVSEQLVPGYGLNYK